MSSFLTRRSGAGFTWTAATWARGLAGIVASGSLLIAPLPAKPSHPYLATVSPISLRFGPPPPDLTSEPTPAAPPAPDGVVGEIAQENVAATVPPEAPEIVAVIPPPSAPVVPPERSAPEPVQTTPAPPAPAAPPTVPILPDEYAPPISAEQFLPYFLPPTLPSAPPSKATYLQK
ncbi:MAG TPA: hypothetical protein VHF69_11610 [Candidatus Synoicihabitans sp.]|nr:hypothetical protein [Candidatus Synoicihabitans sp.]